MFNLKKMMVMVIAIASNTLFAGSMGAINANPETFVTTLSLGPVWTAAGQTQTLFLAPGVEKTYAVDKSSQAVFDGELFVGKQRQINNLLTAQFGLAIAATSNAPVSGSIWDDADPIFNNYAWSYHVQHTHIAIKGKLLANRDIYFLTPWVSASLGAGLNRAYEYKSTPRIFQAVAMSPFESHTTTAFTYTLGTGVQRNVTQHLALGVGYEFADWGKSSLARAEGQTLGSGLSLNHLYTNGLLFNLTYSA